MKTQRPLQFDDIGHSVRNQISTIQSYSELLRDQILGPVDGEQSRALSAILKAVDEIDQDMHDLFELVGDPSGIRPPRHFSALSGLS